VDYKELDPKIHNMFSKIPTAKEKMQY
jgi:hypothetical protein